MVIKYLFFINIILLSNTSQSQIGFGMYLGVSNLFSKNIILESPKNTFKNTFSFAFPNLVLNTFYVQKKNIYEIQYENNHYSLSISDNSKNTIFFPELRNGKGSEIKSGGVANTFSFSYGRNIIQNKLTLSTSISCFLSKHKPQYYNIGGIITGQLDSLGNELWEWSIIENSTPIYSNNLITFGIGLNTKLQYEISRKVNFQFKLEFNRGFVDIIEKSFETKFISYNEPEKNKIYHNSIITKGTNFKLLFGINYILNKKSS